MAHIGLLCDGSHVYGQLLMPADGQLQTARQREDRHTLEQPEKSAMLAESLPKRPHGI